MGRGDKWTAGVTPKLCKPKASPVAAQTTSSPVLVGRPGVSSMDLRALGLFAVAVTNSRLDGSCALSQISMSGFIFILQNKLVILF